MALSPKKEEFIMLKYKIVNMMVRTLSGLVKDEGDGTWFLGGYDVPTPETIAGKTTKEQLVEALWENYGISSSDVERLVDYAQKHGKASSHFVTTLHGSGYYHADVWVEISR